MRTMGTYAGKPAGSGANFKKLASDLAKKGVKNPKALAAWIGRKKYGKKKFQAMAARGRKRS
jgi:hypothetical protein